VLLGLHGVGECAEIAHAGAEDDVAELHERKEDHTKHEHEPE